MIDNRALAGVLLIGVAMAQQTGASADAASDARKAIQTVYEKRAAAEEKKDAEGSFAALAPDFVFVSKDGQKGDAKLLKRRISPLFSMMQSVKSRSQIQQFSLRGKDATATVKSHLEMLIINPQTQAPQKIVADAVSVDLWTRTGAGWLQKRMTTRSENATMDGKSVSEQMKLNSPSGKSNTGHKKKAGK